jgi:hypothetical protein
VMPNSCCYLPVAYILRGTVSLIPEENKELRKAEKTELDIYVDRSND